LEPLTDEYEFIYYDQRGCGKSTRPFDRFASSNFFQNTSTLEQTLGLGAQVADVERIRKILGEEQLLIVGHSFGAFLAALYAAEFPENVKGLILVAPADTLVMPPEHGGLFEEIRDRLPEEMKEDFAAFLDDYLDFGGIFSKSEADLQALHNEFARFYLVAAQVSDFSGNETVERGPLSYSFRPGSFPNPR
jgi:proline iminopeptidase